MTAVPKTDPRVTEAVEQIRSLRRLTAQTGTFTRRSQSKVLAELPDEVLLTVSTILATDKTEEIDRGSSKTK